MLPTFIALSCTFLFVKTPINNFHPEEARMLPHYRCCRIHSEKLVFVTTMITKRLEANTIRSVRQKQCVSRRSCSGGDCSDNIDVSVVQQETARWIEDVVLGMNLCPFAFKPIRDSKLSIHVFQSQKQAIEISEEWILDLSEFVSQEMLRLDKAEGETSIIVVPTLFPENFRSYLSFLNHFKSRAMRQHHLQRIQIAPFHPLYTFADSSDENAARNLIQRSPYPMIHLLRTDDLDAAADAMNGDTSKVWQRNADLMDFLQLKLGSVQNVERAMNRREKSPVDANYLLSLLSSKDVPKDN